MKLKLEQTEEREENLQSKRQQNREAVLTHETPAVNVQVGSAARAGTRGARGVRAGKGCDPGGHAGCAQGRGAAWAGTQPTSTALIPPSFPALL